MNNRSLANSINQPVKVTWIEATSRLMNLAIALLNSRQARPFEWIHKNVQGYREISDTASAKRQFDRDRAALSKHAGLQLAEHTVDSGYGSAQETIKGWGLEAAEVLMPRVNFSAAEKEVLATAAQWAHGHEQQSVAETAFRKLASAGLAAPTSPSVVSNVPDQTDLDKDSLQALFRALDRGLRIEFDYYPAPLTEPTRRQLEPWAYATIGGRMYVTGYEPDKKAQRTFRLARLGDVHALPQFIQHPAPEGKNNHELVRAGLARSGELVDATVEFRGPGAWELRAAAETTDETRCILRGVERRWLVRTAAAYSTDAVLVAPEDVSAEVREILRTAAQNPRSESPCEQSVDESHPNGDRTSMSDTIADYSTVDAEHSDFQLMVPEHASSKSSAHNSPEPRYYGEQFARCVDILAWFTNHPGGSFMSAARDLGASVPQIKHELKNLQLCGLPGYLPGSLIEIEFHKTGASVQFSAGIDSPIRLTPDEATAVRVSLDAIHDVVSPNLVPLIAQLSSKIATLVMGASTPNDAFGALDSASHPSPDETEAGEQQGVNLGKEGTTHPQLHQALTDAIRERRTVDVDYISLSSDTRTHRRLLPDHLGVVDGETYLWARQEDAANTDQRKFALSRMTLREVGQLDSAGARVQPQIDSANPFGWSEEGPWVTIAVNESARWMLEYQQMWVIDDDVEAHGGETLVTMPGTGDWIERFLIAYSPSVRCVQPLELSARVRSRAGRGLANYGADAPC